MKKLLSMVLILPIFIVALSTQVRSAASYSVDVQNTGPVAVRLQYGWHRVIDWAETVVRPGESRRFTFNRDADQIPWFVLGVYPVTGGAKYNYHIRANSGAPTVVTIQFHNGDIYVPTSDAVIPGHWGNGWDRIRG